MAAAAPHIGALPANALQHILLTATTHDNLLRFVATCARVCGEWWRVVGDSAAYGRGLPRGRRDDLKSMLWYDGDEDERARVLKAITKALEREGEEAALHLFGMRIADAGAAALGAALLASRPRIRFTRLSLTLNDLTAAGIASLAPALSGR